MERQIPGIGWPWRFVSICEHRQARKLVPELDGLALAVIHSDELQDVLAGIVESLASDQTVGRGQCFAVAASRALIQQMQQMGMGELAVAPTFLPMQSLGLALRAGLLSKASGRPRLPRLLRTP